MTLIGGAVNVILLLFKFVAGIVGHSAIELDILMDGTITLNEAHDKASEVEDLLRTHYGPDTHVAVHVEPK